MSFLQRFRGLLLGRPVVSDEAGEASPDAPPPITVVSGLPRSGTSLMMRMLEAGGLPILADGERAADEDNPRGYYELEAVKGLPRGEDGWIPEARGKAVKVISALLPYLPELPDRAESGYRVLFLRRAMPEVLASQKAMLRRRGEDPDAVDDATMAARFQAHLAEIEAWRSGRPDLAWLEVDYNRLVADPAPAVGPIVAFLRHPMDAAAMAGVVEPGLYRNRG